MKHHPFTRTAQRGSALIIVMLFVTVSLGLTLAFLHRSHLTSMLAGTMYDVKSSNYQMEAAYEKARGKVDRAVDGIILQGRLPFANTGALTDETSTSIVNEYDNGNELQFLKDIIVAQAYSAAGVLSTTHEFKSFTSAFPTTWTDQDTTDDIAAQVKYTFTAHPVVQIMSPVNQIIFDYTYKVESRAYGSERYSYTGSEDAGVIRITLQGAPFSQWSLFRHQTTSTSGAALYFAGANSSSLSQEVFNGPVHTNTAPNFYGHPVFNGPFTSAVATSSWNQVSNSSYSCCADFNDVQLGGSAYNTSMPSNLYNTARLAAGDTDANAATNNTSYTNANIRSWLTNYAGGVSAGSASGTMASGTSAVPAGIYIPINNTTSKVPTGGVYVQGDARITMDVVQGSTMFSSAQWGQIQAGHQSCKFQKIKIDSLTSGVADRDIYIADDPCNVNYVFDGTSGATTHMVLNGRINGNIHVDGAIDELGGASRTRPAVATDFGMTISAQKDVYIKNDIQYEDAEYVTMDSAGTMGTTVVATPTGTVGSSGYTPDDAGLAGIIDAHSETVLGIISVKNSVRIHAAAVANINLHAAVYAGNSAALSSGYGCGSGSNAGCGFGVVNYDTVTGRGDLKVLGSISEYRSQAVGVLSTGTGYQRRYAYDSRFRQDLTPPGFPISNQLQAYPQILPIRSWKLVRN